MTRDRNRPARQRKNIYAPMANAQSVTPAAPTDLTPLAITLIITVAVLTTAYSIVAQGSPIVNAVLATMDGLVIGLVAVLLPGLADGGWRSKYWNLFRAIATLAGVALMLPFPLLPLIHPGVPGVIATAPLLCYVLERAYRRRQLQPPHSAPGQ